MKKSKCSAVILAMILAFSVFAAGCAGGKEAAETSGVSESSEVVSVHTSEASVSEDAESEAETEEAADTKENEEAEKNEEAEEAEETFEASEITGLQPVTGEVIMPTGDAAEVTEPGGFVELSEEELEEAKRSVRAYKKSGDSLLINKAKSFYYYEQLNDDEQELYDAMLAVAEDPTAKGYISGIFTNLDPTADSFYDQCCKVYYAMIYDHPEFFWIYNSDDLYIQWSGSKSDVKGMNWVSFSLNKPYENYNKELKAFNKAVTNFLAEIDLNASDKKISRQIHDRLLKMVKYDYNVCANLSERTNRAHTAYGALVKNSQGDKHYAVCDGYAQAYVYLMQQAGLQAIMVTGMAGAPGNAGGHAWNMAKLDGKWVEIDVTWDDVDSASEITSPDDQPFYNYVEEALSDKDYKKLRNHYLYAVSTGEIRNFYTSDKYNYYSKDGLYWVNLVGDSVHYRDSETDRSEYLSELIKLAPIAL